MMAFTRDAMGRKSMSEKRRRQFDPRVTSFYQQLQQSKSTFQLTICYLLFLEIYETKILHKKKSSR